MRDVILKTSVSDSVIHCGRGSFYEYATKLAEKQLYVITDSNVYSLYGDVLKETFGDFAGTIIPAGEESKNQETLFSILRDMLRSGMRRNCTVVAFGGGVVGDIAGLAASLYMRGTALVQIPTTLLAQVDSSVGGKTAVDMLGVKNVIGTFYQPEEVIIDSRFLSTLTEREIRCGLGEIIKYGALNGDIFKKLSAAESILSCAFSDEITHSCVELKAEVVVSDERDLSGARKSLNLGHTTGHAFELYYGEKSHGEYVLIGMYYELYIAVKKGVCGREYAQGLIKLISGVIDIPSYKDVDGAAAVAVHDKKNSDEKISLIVPSALGEWTEMKLGFAEYAELLKECASNVKVTK